MNNQPPKMPQDASEPKSAVVTLPDTQSPHPAPSPQLGRVELTKVQMVPGPGLLKPKGKSVTLKNRQKAAAQRPLKPSTVFVEEPSFTMGQRADAKATIIARLATYTADKTYKQSFGLQAPTEWALVLKEITAIIESVL